MAKQTGDTFITGTVEDLCFYKMNGQYYVRMKSSLTGKRVKKSAGFSRTMESAKQLGTASAIASGVYRKIEKNKRKVIWYRKMTGTAKLLLKNGESKEQIWARLLDYISDFLPKEKTVVKSKINTRKSLFTYRTNCEQKIISYAEIIELQNDILKRTVRYRRRRYNYRYNKILQ